VIQLADQLRQLLPPVSYNGLAPNLSAAIEAEANALNFQHLQTEATYSAIFPDSGLALTDWERVLALPDICLAGESQITRQRIQAVLSKLKSHGGRSKPFFIELAQALGYEITITTFKSACAGIAGAGDPLNGGDWPYTWRINAPAVTISYAAAGITGAGEPLAAWGNKALECRLSQMKPAGSILLFGYGDQ
jgi:uncharacterized protein YmfQ (DUF2313 family)